MNGNKVLLILIVTFLGFINISNSAQYALIENNYREPRTSITIGSCTWVISRTCPDTDIKFYLFTRSNKYNRQLVHIDESREKSNLSESYFNPRNPTKIIIHGYNSDMYLGPLISMKDEYLQIRDYNLFYVDWSVLSIGPCYFSAVHNTRHVGNCIGQLLERILDEGSANIHLIGFSLGAHVPNYVAQSVGSFIIPRITGLDPAMPLFITASKDNKLDPSDAAFVDVIHTNAFVQGKVERCGHVDFYMNGGIIQPGCENNPFACSHHRAADYYMESIRSYKGFWGWPCSSYISYLLGLCPPINNLTEAGENCNTNTEGMFLIATNAQSPYAKGRWPEYTTKNLRNITILDSNFNNYYPSREMPLDQFGKLDGSFNNLEFFPTPFTQDLTGSNWPYFNEAGTNEITDILRQNSDIEIKTDVWQYFKKNSKDIPKSELNDNLEVNKKLEDKNYDNNQFKIDNLNTDKSGDKDKLNLNKNKENSFNKFRKNNKFNWINDAVFDLPKVNEH